MKMIYKYSLFVLFFASISFAQETGVSAELERTASTTPQEKITYASEANDEIRDAVKTVTKLLDQARRDDTVEALQCLNNRLTSIRALLQVGEGAESAMHTALESGETERAGHEFRKIAVALTKTRQLLAEAQRCSDDSNQNTGDSNINLNGGLGGDDDDDFDNLDVDEFDLGFDPPDASVKTVYTIIFKNTDGEMKKIYLTLDEGVF